GSESTNSLTLASRAEADGEATAVYRNPHGHTLTLHKKTLANAAEYHTVFENTSEKPAVLEMLSSFAFAEVRCDKIHRLQSFWSLVSQASFSDAHETAAVPIIAANLHRAIRPSMSQIWAVLRETDSLDRIYYTIAATFLGRMCLSGDISALSEAQWDAVSRGIAFYNKAKDLIKHGFTERFGTNVESYNAPVGFQGVLRKNGNRALLVVHTFAQPCTPSLEVLERYTVAEEYGANLTAEFQAKAFLLVKK
ncbi:MAG: hypothetical protein LBH54_03500, partial [Clostridiales bacterium]|nr:hypothetical protein [Clostridiales bacterium]